VPLSNGLERRRATTDNSRPQLGRAPRLQAAAECPRSRAEGKGRDGNVFCGLHDIRIRLASEILYLFPGFPQDFSPWFSGRNAGNARRTRTHALAPRARTRTRARAVVRGGRRARGRGWRVPRMPHAPPQVLPRLTLGGRLSMHPDSSTSCCGAVLGLCLGCELICRPNVLVVCDALATATATSLQLSSSWLLE
jgi:hypothetical protein